MKKILLVEDRTQRQKLFMEDTKIDLARYSSILDNFIDKKYDEFVVKIQDDNFELDNYDVIISHKSAFKDFNESILSKLENHCKENDKVLVLFSGGIDANYYLKDDNFELIELNSKTFYSEFLKLFLEDVQDGNLHPLILCYGTKWKLNIVLNILEKLNLYIDNLTKDSVLYNAFFRDNSDIGFLESLKFDLFDKNDRRIKKEDIVKLRDSLKAYIKESLEDG